MSREPLGTFFKEPKAGENPVSLHAQKHVSFPPFSHFSHCGCCFPRCPGCEGSFRAIPARSSQATWEQDSAGIAMVAVAVVMWGGFSLARSAPVVTGHGGGTPPPQPIAAATLLRHSRREPSLHAAQLVHTEVALGLPPPPEQRRKQQWQVRWGLGTGEEAMWLAMERKGGGILICFQDFKKFLGSLLAQSAHIRRWGREVGGERLGVGASAIPAAQVAIPTLPFAKSWHKQISSFWFFLTSLCRYLLNWPKDWDSGASNIQMLHKLYLSFPTYNNTAITNIIQGLDLIHSRMMTSVAEAEPEQG